MGVKSTNSKANPPKRSTRPWWEAKKTSDDDGAELARRLFDTVNTLENAQLASIQGMLRAWKIYNGRDDLSTFTWFGSSQKGFNSASLGAHETPHWNLIESALQTQQSRIAADPVKVMAMTDGGNYSEKRKAEQLNKFSDGATEASGARAEGPEVFVDGGWAGTGFLHVFKDNSRSGDWEICAEKVFPAEILVDEAECLVTNGKPYQLYRRRVISRTKLEADYPKKKALIRMAQTEMIKLNDNYALDEMIVVVEAWHRRSNYRTKDGRRAIVISSGTLEDDPKWEADHFPLAIYRWKKNSLGFHGKSLVEQTHTIQAAVTKGNYVIDRSLEICGMPYVATEDGSDIVFEHLSGGIGAQVKYAAGTTPPQLMTPAPVAAEHFQNLEMQVKRFYDISRLSEQSATGEVQSNIKSGEGIRTQQAVESLAWKQTVKDYQNFWIDVVKLHVEVAREIAAMEPGFKASTKDGKFLRSVRFLDFDLATSKYTWALYPTSLLPETPEGKFDKVQELIQSGMVQPEQGLYMLDIPDTKSITMYNEAVIRWAEWAVSRILDERINVKPLPFLGAGLSRVIETAQAAYLTAQMEEVGKAQLAMLQTFWQQCIDLQQKTMAAAAAPAGAGPVQAVPTAGGPGPGALAPAPGSTPQARAMKAPLTPLVPQVANAG